MSRLFLSRWERGGLPSPLAPGHLLSEVYKSHTTKNRSFPGMRRLELFQILQPQHFDSEAEKHLLAYRPAAGGAVTSVRIQVATIRTVY